MLEFLRTIFLINFIYISAEAFASVGWFHFDDNFKLIFITVLTDLFFANIKENHLRVWHIICIIIFLPSLMFLIILKLVFKPILGFIIKILNMKIS